MKFGSLPFSRLGMALLGAVLLGALAYVATRAGPLAPTQVTVHEVVEGSITPALFGIGTVEARRSYLIGPTAAGRVLRVAVDVGDPVKAGQLLAEMDPVDLDERLSALDASLDRARHALDAVQAQRLDALARKDLAAINAKRYADLGDQNFISVGVVQGKLQELASADANVSGIDANLAAARADLRRLAAERSGLLSQRAKLRLVAPADGVVIGRDAEAGSTVVAGQAVVRLAEPGSLWVRVRFDQGRSAGLASGLQAQITLRSHPGTTLPGSVARVEVVSDSITEERVAHVSFEQRPAGLSIGELAEVTVALPATARAPLLPNASVRQRGDSTGVWIVDGGDLRFAPVRLGRTSLDGLVPAREGVAAGDRVVVHSEKSLRADSRIEVVKAIVGERP